MDINAFLVDRRPRWQRLEHLLSNIDSNGLASLSVDETHEFFRLYRLVSSDLNLAQTRTGNPAILEYLEGMVGRAYANLAIPRDRNIFAWWWRIVRHRFPAALRAESALLGTASLVFLLAAIFSFVCLCIDPELAELFVDAEHLAQSPSERVRMLEAKEEAGTSQINTLQENAIFSTFLFTHNIRVSILAFVFGLTAGIGTLVVIFFNGAMLGAISQLYWSDGELTFLLAWIGPHGALELPCILFAATAGLMIARTQLRRDAGSFRQQLVALRPRLVDITIGAASLLVIAGIIEGGFSQINEPTLPYLFKQGVAAVLFLSLLYYIFQLPIDPAIGESTASLEQAPGPLLKDSKPFVPKPLRRPTLVLLGDGK